MEALFKLWTGYVSSGIEGAAGIIIAIAAAEATWRALAMFFVRPAAPDDAKESIRLRLARWLAVALEFELAADILRTAIAPSWDEIGKLAAIAALRTLLNYFLQREIEQNAVRLQAVSPASVRPEQEAPAAGGVRKPGAGGRQ